MINKQGQVIYGEVYRRTNKFNGNVYVGQTTRTGDPRWYECVRDAIKYGGGFRLGAAIRKYGVEAFEDRFVEYTVKMQDNLEKIQHELDRMETFFIIMHQSHICGYNVTLGGQGRIAAQSEETKEQIRQTLAITYATTDLRERIRTSALNRTPESYLHIPCPQEKAHKIRRTLLARYANKELDHVKAKVRIANTGRHNLRKRSRFHLCYNCFKPFEEDNYLDRVFCTQKCSVEGQNRIRKYGSKS